jgi:glycosyltransferase involved in cell wall biosynthesis
VEKGIMTLSTSHRGSVVAIVVTHNRLSDLKLCLAALRAQTYQSESIIVVDNASTDGTAVFLEQHPDIAVIRLSKNVGGAGGFKAGMTAAEQTTARWWWLMDDDCLPRTDALERLMSAARLLDPTDRVAGLLPTVAYGDNRSQCGSVRSKPLPNNERDGGPFLGLLLSADACQSVGPVRADFFILGDDTEYCLRLRMAGWRFEVVPDAIVAHPDGGQLIKTVFGRQISVTKVPPWKQYYGARNMLVTDMQTRNTPFAARRRRGGWLVEELIYLAKLLIIDKEWGPRRALMRVLGHIDALRGRTGLVIAPGQTFPWVPRTQGQRDAIVHQCDSVR